MPLASTLAAAAIALAASGVLPGPVAAEETSRDATHDVLSLPIESDALPHHAEPARRLGDIVTTSVGFGTDLVVTTKFRALGATGAQEFSWFVQTSDDAPHEYWTASLVVRPGRDQGELTVLDPIAYQPDCASADVDRSARTVTLTIPADCLRNPDWVRVGNGVSVYQGGIAHLDDARRDGVVKRSWKFGPKVARAVS